MNQQNAILQDKDLLFSILCDLKRTSREYTTAVTEANCPTVRQQFQQLLDDTLRLQGQLYNFMQSQGMYNTSGFALGEAITQKVQQYNQTQTQTNQLIQQNAQQLH